MNNSNDNIIGMSAEQVPWNMSFACYEYGKHKDCKYENCECDCHK